MSDFHDPPLPKLGEASSAGVGRRQRAFERAIAEGLERAFQRTLGEERAGARVFELESDRYIIFSDHHRGGRNRADDFRRAERAYHAALAYYLERGYTLVVLGDAEELWEEQPGRVIEAYRYTLELESAFHRKGRYLRIWGNHDDAWRHPDLVRRHLDVIFPGLEVPEGLRLEVQAAGRSLGHLFLVHGHQGTAESDRYSWISRFFVRFVWRNFQRLTGYSLNTPASDWRLRQAHDIAMYRWARPRDGLVLITGHTHRPVFKSRTHASRIQDELEAARRLVEEDPLDEERVRIAAELAAELEWVRTQEQTAPGPEGLIEMERPSYFNTGCCSFLDGDITGLQLAGGEICLVRWPDDDRRPKPQLLERAALDEVLAATTGVAGPDASSSAAGGIAADSVIRSPG